MYGWYRGWPRDTVQKWRVASHVYRAHDDGIGRERQNGNRKVDHGLAMVSERIGIRNGPNRIYGR